MVSHCFFGISLISEIEYLCGHPTEDWTPYPTFGLDVETDPPHIS